MASTRRIVLGANWQKMTDASTVCAIQSRSQGTFEVHVNNTAEPGQEDEGLMFSLDDDRLPNEFSSAGLGGGTEVYARSYDGKAMVVVVTEY